MPAMKMTSLPFGVEFDESAFACLVGFLDSRPYTVQLGLNKIKELKPIGYYMDFTRIN